MVLKNNNIRYGQHNYNVNVMLQNTERSSSDSVDSSQKNI